MKENSVKLYVIRHGETDWNCRRKLQGESDILLNENGRRLAEITRENMGTIPFDLVITSPYQRARETAQIITGNADIPCIQDARIREITWGDWDGLTPEEIAEAGGKERFELFYTNPFFFRGAPGGENIRQVCERGKDFYEELIRNEVFQDKTILVATHGCALRGILNHLYENPSDFWQGGVPANCAVTILEVKHGKSCFLERDKIYYDVSMIQDFYTLKA